VIPVGGPRTDILYGFQIYYQQARSGMLDSRRAK
jgi:hypothetical protein